MGDGRVWHSSPVVCWMQLRVFHFAGSSIIWICPSTVIIGVVVGSREGRQAGRQSWTAVYSRLHGFVDPLPRGDTAHVRPVVFTLVEMAQRLQRCCLVSIPPGMSPPDFQSRGGGLLWLLYFWKKNVNCICLGLLQQTRPWLSNCAIKSTCWRISITTNWNSSTVNVSDATMEREKCHDIKTSSSSHSLFYISPDNDKFQKEMTIALAEKENQFQQQVRKEKKRDV